MTPENKTKNGRVKWYTVIRCYRNLYLTLLFIPLSRLRVLLRHFPNLLINCFNFFSSSSARSFNVSTPYIQSNIYEFRSRPSSTCGFDSRCDFQPATTTVIICHFFFGWICSFSDLFHPGLFCFWQKLFFKYHSHESCRREGGRERWGNVERRGFFFLEKRQNRKNPNR